MERIVCSLYADKRRLIRLVFSFIIYVSYNADFYSILYANVLKQYFSVLRTAWVVLHPSCLLQLVSCFLSTTDFFKESKARRRRPIPL